MSGNLLVRFDEGRVGRTSVSPSLLLYRERELSPIIHAEAQPSGDQPVFDHSISILPN